MAETKKEAPAESATGKSRSRVGWLALLLGLATGGMGASLMEKAHRQKNEMADREAVALAKATQAEAIAEEALAAMEEMKLSEARRDLAERGALDESDHPHAARVFLESWFAEQCA